MSSDRRPVTVSASLGIAHADADSTASVLLRDADIGAAERHDLAIDSGLAHPPRDQLGHLASEIDDEDRIARLDRHGAALKAGAGPVQRAAGALRWGGRG